MLEVSQAMTLNYSFKKSSLIENQSFNPDLIHSLLKY